MASIRWFMPPYLLRRSMPMSRAIWNASCRNPSRIWTAHSLISICVSSIDASSSATLLKSFAVSASGRRLTICGPLALRVESLDFVEFPEHYLRTCWGLCHLPLPFGIRAAYPLIISRFILSRRCKTLACVLNFQS